MFVYHNPDDYKIVAEHHTCEFHKRYPSESYAGCTCSGSTGLHRKVVEQTSQKERIDNKFDPTIHLPEKL